MVEITLWNDSNYTLLGQLSSRDFFCIPEALDKLDEIADNLISAKYGFEREIGDCEGL